MAATFLAIVLQKDPTNTSCLAELAFALETQFMNEEATRILLLSKQPIQDHFVSRYLLAYNFIMCGNLNEARNLLPRLTEAFLPSLILGSFWPRFITILFKKKKKISFLG